VYILEGFEVGPMFIDGPRKCLDFRIQVLF